MVKLCYSLRGLIIIEANISVIGFTALIKIVLRAPYKFGDMNVHLNVPEFPLHSNPNNSSQNAIALFPH